MGGQGGVVRPGGLIRTRAASIADLGSVLSKLVDSFTKFIATQGRAKSPQALHSPCTPLFMQPIQAHRCGGSIPRIPFCCPLQYINQCRSFIQAREHSIVGTSVADGQKESYAAATTRKKKRLAAAHDEAISSWIFCFFCHGHNAANLVFYAMLPCGGVPAVTGNIVFVMPQRSLSPCCRETNGQSDPLEDLMQDAKPCTV